MGRRRTALVVGVVALALVACTPTDDVVPPGPTGTPAPPDATATPLTPSPTGTRTPTATDATELTVPRGDLDAAVLRVTGGAGSILVDGGAHPDHLLEARSDGAAAAPEHSASDGTQVVVVDGGTAVVRLADDVVWEVRVEAGADELDLDLADVRLGRLVLDGGVRSIAVTLGEPDGVVAIDQTAGADRLVLRRPTSAGVRVTVTSGVGQATVDGTPTEGIGAGEELRAEPLDESGAFYDLTVAGGLGSLTVDRP